MGIIDSIIEFDQWLFLTLNGIHHPIFDKVMLFVTHRFPWIPLYLIIIWAAYKQYKKPFHYIAWLVVWIIAADLTASKLCKPYFERLRPCYEPLLEGLVHVPGGCGGTYGFFSSHAANTFTLAFFLFFTKFANKNIRIALLIWATVVSYSRIYVGVHYPIDIMAGALLGLIYGKTASLVLEKYNDKLRVL